MGISIEVVSVVAAFMLKMGRNSLLRIKDGIYLSLHVHFLSIICLKISDVVTDFSNFYSKINFFGILKPMVRPEFNFQFCSGLNFLILPYLWLQIEKKYRN